MVGSICCEFRGLQYLFSAEPSIHPAPLEERELFNEHVPARRSPAAVAFSLALHAGAIAFLLFLNSRHAFTPRPNKQLERLMFMALAEPSTVVKVAAAPPSVNKDTLDALAVEAPPEPEIPKPEPPKPEPPPPAPEAPKPEPPPPPKPEVTVGAFDAPATSAASAVKGSVQSTGFDAPQAAAPDLKLQAAQTGLFGGGAAQARPGTDRRGSIATSGFEGSQGRQAQAARGQVTSSGFGSNTPAQAAAKPAGTVQTAGFGDTPSSRPAQTAAAAPKPAVPPTQVEVLSKPTPTYTDEARAAKVEGDVILEVVFTAGRQVKVVRVVRGLGHGLDDMARSAAEKMTFKPATQGGEPVDVRATVTIVFRLT